MLGPTVEQVVEMALGYFAEVGVEVTLTDEGLTTEDGCVFGLAPLRRRLVRVEPSEWEASVRTHFEVLRSVDPELPSTFEEARHNLRSAVVSEADLGMFDGAIMERPLVDGLGERVMLRRGSLGMTVTAEVVEGWEVEAEAVWARARSGSLLDETVHRQRFRVGDVRTSYTALRGGRWTSTQVLDLEPHLRHRAGFGALVVVPARDEVLFHEIRNERFTDAAMGMLSHATTAYVEAPLPVGCDLYWWDNGNLSRICVPGEDRFRYVRVPEFARMLWRLEEAVASQQRPATG